MDNYQTVEEWEALVGEHVRASRIASGLDQARLASMANVSVGAVSNLERGNGSSLKTLIAVVKALGRSGWLEALAPPVTVSPLQMLRSRHGAQPRARVRAPRPATSAVT